VQNHAATEEFLRRQQFSPQRLKQTRFRCDFTRYATISRCARSVQTNGR